MGRRIAYCLSGFEVATGELHSVGWISCWSDSWLTAIGRRFEHLGTPLCLNENILWKCLNTFQFIIIKNQVLNFSFYINLISVY